MLFEVLTDVQKQAEEEVKAQLESIGESLGDMAKDVVGKGSMLVACFNLVAQQLLQHAELHYYRSSPSNNMN